MPLQYVIIIIGRTSAAKPGDSKPIAAEKVLHNKLALKRPPKNTKITARRNADFPCGLLGVVGPRTHATAHPTHTHTHTPTQKSLGCIILGMGCRTKDPASWPHYACKFSISKTSCSKTAVWGAAAAAAVATWCGGAPRATAT